jgi:UDP-glucose 4-epimerase
MPQYDNLETIAAHALAWEEKLIRERGGEVQHAQSA